MAVKSMRNVFIVVIAIFFGLPQPAEAQDAVFPLTCNPGVNCFILSYPDMDSAPDSAKDYTCGPSANDGDGSLRIGVASVETLRSGINVLATRDGKVLEIANDVPDLVIASKKDLKRGASLCGNAVILDHGLGMQSAYCHLRQGSITVQPGQRVKAGEKIGQVGQSGYATWPQLGFSIQSSGLFVDPVSSMSPIEGCGFKPRPIVPLPPAFTEYQPAAIVAMGFSTDNMAMNDIVLGRTTTMITMDRMEMKMNLWGMVLGVHKGDEIEVRIRDPRGRSFEYRKILADKDLPRMPVNTSRARGYSGWRQGIYVGEITLTREVEHREVSVTKTVQMVVR